MLTPGQILERLSDRLDLLKGGRDADPRQQTLRATIEWSYDLLYAREQQPVRALSVFAGGCTLEAAEDVAGADLDILQSLVEKSLLRFTGERYWMLETIREYAAERLVESGEIERLRGLHIGHLIAATRSTIAAGPGPLHRDWSHRFEPERANLRDAMTWALVADRLSKMPAFSLPRMWFLCRISEARCPKGDSWLADRCSSESSTIVTTPLSHRALRVSASLAEFQRDHDASRLTSRSRALDARSFE